MPNLPSDWKSLFTDNINITDDLADIIRLINAVGGTTSYTVTFNDNHNKTIASTTLSSGTNVISGFGRDIVLDLNGEVLKFNTMTADIGYDVLKATIEFPTNDLTVKFDGTFAGSVYDIAMPSDKELNIVPPKKTLTVKVDGQTGTASDIYMNEDKTVNITLPKKTLTVKIDGYTAGGKSASNVYMASDQTLDIIPPKHKLTVKLGNW